MRMTVVKSRRVTVIGGVLVLFVILSFLPSRYCGYGNILHDWCSGLMMPLSHPLSSVTSKIRMRILPVPDGAAELMAQWEKKQEEVNLSLRLMNEIKGLGQEVQMLSDMRRQLPDESFVLPKAQVTGRSTGPQTYSLCINGGSNEGMREGQPVVSGADVVGRLVQVGRFSSTVELITSRGNRIDAMITPALTSVFDLVNTEYDRCQLDAAGVDRFVSLVVQGVDVEAGYYIRLNDDEWPASVQGFIIGQVELVEPERERPLEWKRVVIKTRRSLRYLDSVRVIVPVVDEKGVESIEPPEGTKWKEGTR